MPFSPRSDSAPSRSAPAGQMGKGYAVKIFVLGNQARSTSNFWTVLMRRMRAAGHEVLCAVPAGDDAADAAIRAIGEEDPPSRKVRPCACAIIPWTARASTPCATWPPCTPCTACSGRKSRTCSSPPPSSPSSTAAWRRVWRGCRTSTPPSPAWATPSRRTPFSRNASTA